MSAISFPNIQAPTFPYECEYEDNSIISKFEDGTQQSRKKFTKSRRKWTLKWENLSRADYKTLMNFIVNTVSFSALSFQWVEWDSKDDVVGGVVTPETVTVRVTKVGKWTNNALHYWGGTIELTEV